MTTYNTQKHIPSSFERLEHNDTLETYINNGKKQGENVFIQTWNKARKTPCLENQANRWEE